MDTSPSARATRGGRSLHRFLYNAPTNANGLDYYARTHERLLARRRDAPSATTRDLSRRAPRSGARHPSRSSTRPPVDASPAPEASPEPTPWTSHPVYELRMMLLIGMKMSFTKKPTNPMITNPVAVRRAIIQNSRASGLVHRFTSLALSLANSLTGLATMSATSMCASTRGERRSRRSDDSRRPRSVLVHRWKEFPKATSPLGTADAFRVDAFRCAAFVRTRASRRWRRRRARGARARGRSRPRRGSARARRVAAPGNGRETRAGRRAGTNTKHLTETARRGDSRRRARRERC